MTHIEALGAFSGKSYKAMNAEIDPNRLTEMFDLTLSGHYHKTQFLSERFLYVGSPLQINAGEKDEKKGFWDVAVFKDKIVLKMVETRAPKYVSLVIDKDTPVYDDMIDNNYVTLEIRDELINSQEIAQLIKESGARKVQVIRQEPKKKDSRIELSSISDDKTLVGKYVDSFEGLDRKKERLKKVGLEILGEEK